MIQSLHTKLQGCPHWDVITNVIGHKKRYVSDTCAGRYFIYLFLFFLSHPSKLGLEQMQGKLDFEDLASRFIDGTSEKLDKETKTRLFIVYMYISF